MTGDRISEDGKPVSKPVSEVDAPRPLVLITEVPKVEGIADPKALVLVPKPVGELEAAFPVFDTSSPVFVREPVGKLEPPIDVGFLEALGGVHSQACRFPLFLLPGTYSQAAPAEGVALTSDETRALVWSP